MANLMESSGIGRTTTQISFGMKVMKTKLNPENIFGS